MNVEVNYVAVVLAGIAFMILGFLWYSPLLFAKPWMKLKGYTAASMKEAQSEMGKLYGLSFVLSLITAYVLSHVMGLSENFYGYTPVMTGVTTAFMMWLGFIMPVQVTATIFGEKKWKLLSIDTGYQLVGMLIMGVVLGIFS